MIYVSMIVSFLLLICLAIAGTQNETAVPLKFVQWTMVMPLELEMSSAVELT